MGETAAALKPIDRLEITILVDNSIDVFLPSTNQIRRARTPTDLPWGERKALISEHGYSALVSVHSGDHSASLLFDAGVSTDALVHNMDVLEIRPQELHSIVLSHGHVDHTQGLLWMIKRLGKRRMPILLHPDAFLNRKVILPDNHELHSPAPNRHLLEQENAEFIEQRGVSDPDVALQRRAWSFAFARRYGAGDGPDPSHNRIREGASYSLLADRWHVAVRSTDP